MIFGTIKEIKDNENRVGILPDGAKALTEAGHDVIIQRNAGRGSGYSDADYKQAGAKLVATAHDVVKEVDVLIKVKEPILEEYSLLKLMQCKTLFTFLHLAAVDKRLTDELVNNNITAIAYETVEDRYSHLPLLKPMSEVAGVLAIQYGAQYLQKKYGGRGVTLGVIENATSANVVIIGGGVVGTAAARTAAGLGCKVTIIEREGTRYKKLPSLLKKYLGKLSNNIEIIKSSPSNISKVTADADLLVGSILIHGAKAPRIVTESMVHNMKSGAVIVDVAIDQGGCIWGSKPTSHSDPIYKIDDIIYCNITNMPGQVPRQSSQALTQATLPYLLKMAELGVDGAIKKDKGFAKGVNTINGTITYKAVAEALNMLNNYKELKV